MISSRLPLLIGLYLTSIASSNPVQQKALNVTNEGFLNLPLDEDEVTILRTPPSHNTSWVTPLSASPIFNISEHDPSMLNGTDEARNGLTTKCAGATYGYGLSVPSCLEVWSLLPKSATLRTGKTPQEAVAQSRVGEPIVLLGARAVRTMISNRASTTRKSRKFLPYLAYVVTFYLSSAPVSRKKY